MQKLIILLVASLAVVISSIFLLKPFYAPKPVTAQPPAGVVSTTIPVGKVSGSPITVQGVILCLPHKATGGMQSDICALGLKDNSGKYYMLDDSKNDNKNLKGADINTQVFVVGTLSPHPDSSYQDVGIISITKLSRIALDITPTSQQGSILGVVLLQNLCPVIKNPPDPNCADKPYQTDLAVTTADGASVVASVSSDADGRFKVNVPAGSYMVRSADTARKYPACRIPEPITVSAGKSTEIKILCDTGIR